MRNTLATPMYSLPTGWNKRRRGTRAWLALVTLALGACTQREQIPYAVEETSLTALSADLADGKTTSVAATRAYIERINAFDAPLHAVIMIAPDALAQAAASDKRRKAGHALGPLDGVPILLKDNIDAVGMPTTAGSYALADNKPAQDSEVARRLRAAGAVILGKNNLSQWAGWRATKSFNGSTIGGEPHNPYDTTRTPAGSSSGGAIAAAASFAAASIGTETSGSITAPASVNGVVGLKPTVALISRRGIVPISHNQDIAGPITRTVPDAAMLLNVIAGSDSRDAQTVPADAHKTDYTKALDPEALKGVRIGVLRRLRAYNLQTAPAFDEALEVLKDQGAELIDVDASKLEDLSPEMRIVLEYDFKHDINAYLSGTSDKVKTRTLTDLIAFGKVEEHERRHTQEIFEESDATPGLDTPAYKTALEYEKRRAGPEGLLRLMVESDVSALITPTVGAAPPILPDGIETGGPVEDRRKGETPISMIAYAAMAGYPHLTVPMGQFDGLPLGLSFIAGPWEEARLLGYGYAYENAAHKRVPPVLKAAPLDRTLDQPFEH